MAKLAGAALKLLQTFLYALTFCCAGIVLAFYSYFLSVQADRDVPIPTWEKAVEGISGAGVLYSILAVIFTCCLGGITFFAFLAMVLDIAFAAGFVALAVLTRDGAQHCDANPVNTPLGNGDPSSKNGWGRNNGDDNYTYAVSLGTACRYNKASFAVSVIGAFLFVIACFVQLFLGRHHRREKRFGPSPANNYTSGSGRRFWQRRQGPKTTRDAELATAGGLTAGGLAADKPDVRPSHETGYTGSTMAPATAAYDSHGKPVTPAGGYHTAPSTNPYGYDNMRNSATNY